MTALAVAVACVGASSIGASTGAQQLQLVRPPKGGLPKPTPQQLKYGGSINALIHFNMATFFHDGEKLFIELVHVGTPTQTVLACEHFWSVPSKMCGK